MSDCRETRTRRNSRPKDGVASLAYSRWKNGVASLAYSRWKNGVASLAYSRWKNGVASLAYSRRFRSHTSRVVRYPSSHAKR
jgi:hypothetical protein